MVIALVCALATANVVLVSSEFTDETFDSSAVNSWKLVDFAKNPVSKCGGQSIVGGFKVASGSSARKTYKLDFTPSHITVTFDLWYIDSWDAGWVTLGK